MIALSNRTGKNTYLRYIVAQLLKNKIKKKFIYHSTHRSIYVIVYILLGVLEYRKINIALSVKGKLKYREIKSYRWHLFSKQMVEHGLKTVYPMHKNIYIFI